jgi:predicted NAD/FAD-binding protein
MWSVASEPTVHTSVREDGDATMKLAIVGTGIAGMTAAHLLHQGHDLTIFEAGAYIGGHTNTVEVEQQGRSYAVDTGFIVFNDWTYPNFIALLDRLGVESQPSDMSFSVRCEQTGLEYNGTSLNSLFAQRRNLLRPSFYRMIRDILRFNRDSLELLDEPGPGPSLGIYLAEPLLTTFYQELYRSHGRCDLVGWSRRNVEVSGAISRPVF